LSREIAKTLGMNAWHLSRNVITVLKSGHVQGIKRRGKEECIYDSGNKASMKETPRCSLRTILKWIIEKQDGVEWTGFIWLRIGPVESSCDHGNEPLGSIKCWEILE
jgi:hypothetical protein